MSDFDYKRLADAIRDGNAGSNFSGVGKGSFGGAVEQFASAVGTFANSSLNFQTNLKSLVDLVKPLGNLAGPLGALTTGVGNVLAEQGERILRLNTAAGQYGAQGTSNTRDLLMNQANTRLAMDQFIEIILKNTNDLRGLDISMGEGLRKYTESFDAMVSQDGFLDKMKIMGLTIEDVNRVYKDMIKRYGTVDLNDETNRRKFHEEMQKIVLDMKAAQAVWGTSLDKQVKNKEDYQNDPKIFAAARSAELSGDAAKGQDIRNVGNAISTLPDTLKKAVTESITTPGGNFNGETMRALSILAPEALNGIRQAGQAMQYGNAEERKAALDFYNNKLPGMLANISPERLKLVSTGQAGKTAEQLITELMTPMRAQDVARAQRPGMDPTQAIVETAVRNALGQYGLGTRPPGTKVGEYDQGRTGTLLLVEAQDRMLDIDKNLNDVLTQTIIKFTGLNTVIDKIVTSQTMTDPKVLQEKITGFYNKLVSEGKNVEEIRKSFQSNEFWADALGLKGGRATATPKAPGEREQTTFGTIGQPYETEKNLLTYMNENNSRGKREGVFSEDQINSIVRTALVTGDGMRLPSMNMSSLNSIPTKVSDAVSSAVGDMNISSDKSTSSQDDMVTAMQDLNKNVLELVSLQRQNNKITENGLKDVAESGSLYS